MNTENKLIFKLTAAWVNQKELSFLCKMFPNHTEITETKKFLILKYAFEELTCMHQLLDLNVQDILAEVCLCIK